MVAARALVQTPDRSDPEAELRCCVRDLLALSNLPLLWVKADAGQIADSLAQLAVSMLDTDFACVILRDPELEVARCHDQSVSRAVDLALVREKYRPNSQFEIDHETFGPLRAMCLPIGRAAGSGLITFSRRAAFPSDTERMLLRVAANQAAIAIDRWKSEVQISEQARILERLKETETALYTFTDQLFRAETPSTIYRAGLEAILRVLSCDRASILLFDDSGVMRFVAWHALSENYRRAVEGHSPWKPEDHTADPINIGDTEKASGVSEELKLGVRAEGIAALSFIPIFVGGRVAGQFMAYYDAPHSFTPKEIEAGSTVAQQLGFALERLRAEQATQRLATIVESSDDAIISKNLDGIILTWNLGAERIFGYRTEEVVGKPVTILIPPERFDEEPKILERLRRGERIEHYETVRRRKDAALIDISLTVSPVRDGTGRIIAASKIARDISKQKRAAEAEKVLVQELKHRTSNLLAVIQSIAHNTLSGSGSVESARIRFEGRLQALARACRQLTESNWSGASLHTIVHQALEPFAVRVHIDGADVILGAKDAQNFALAVHELATNATKYGALSNSGGRVNITWGIAAGRSGANLTFRWQERGGPPAIAPKRVGFGTTLLRAIFRTVTLDYSSEGLTCEIQAALEKNLNPVPAGEVVESI
jgi:PAS domain S-box-containing protein